MQLKMGSQQFTDVKVPLLWDTRAIVQDRKGRLSVIDLAGDRARLEVVGDLPAPGIQYRPVTDGFIVKEGSTELYHFDSHNHRIASISVDLPDCEISQDGMSIGGVHFKNNSVSGFEVGVLVMRGGAIAVGAPLPRGLAQLRLT